MKGDNNHNRRQFLKKGIHSAALDSGVRLLATSPYYANGNNEIVLGEAIKDRDRDSVYVATNGIPDGIDRKAGLFTNESKTEKFLKKIDESLKPI